MGKGVDQSLNTTFQSHIFEKWKDFQKRQTLEILFEIVAEVNSDMAYRVE